MIVEVKQAPDQSASAIGLDKHNRSKLPGVFEIVQPAKGIDGRWITGIDEDCLSINTIKDKDERDKVKEEVKGIRESLSRATNVDLSATNDKFWETYKISLRDNFSLNLTNPQDTLKYYVLLANGYAAPEQAVLGSPEYAYTKYYISRKDEEAKDKVVSTKQYDRARAKLLDLSENKNKLFIIANYLLGDRVKQEMSSDILYNEVSNFINSKAEPKNVKTFLDAASKTPEDLQFKITVDKAIKKNVIRFRDGYYQRGNATYGKSLQDVLNFFKKVENGNEFLSLKEEVDES